MNQRIKHIIQRTVNVIGYDIISRKGNILLSHHLVNLFKRLDINCVLDVGANKGQYGLTLRLNGYEGNIISFEPIEENYIHLNRRCKKDPRWYAYNVALGSCEKTQIINVTESSDFSSFLSPNTYAESQFGDEVRVVRTEVVHIKRLDSIIEDIKKDLGISRFFLKTDTQGYDLEVLDGASNYCDEILGMQSELSLIPIYEGMRGFTESLTEFHSRGFEITGLFPVTRDVRTLRVIECDCIMIRVSK